MAIAEQVVHDLPVEEQTRRLLGRAPKEILTLFFYLSPVHMGTTPLMWMTPTDMKIFLRPQDEALGSAS